MSLNLNSCVNNVGIYPKNNHKVQSCSVRYPLSCYRNRVLYRFNKLPLQPRIKRTENGLQISPWGYNKSGELPTCIHFFNWKLLQSNRSCELRVHRVQRVNRLKSILIILKSTCTEINKALVYFQLDSLKRWFHTRYSWYGWLTNWKQQTKQHLTEFVGFLVILLHFCFDFCIHHSIM